MSSELFRQIVHRVMESPAQGTYAQIATGIATSDYIDRSCISNITFTCVVMSVDLSANETDFGNAASPIPTWLPAFKQNTGPDSILSMEAENYVHTFPRTTMNGLTLRFQEASPAERR